VNRKIESALFELTSAVIESRAARRVVERHTRVDEPLVIKSSAEFMAGYVPRSKEERVFDCIIETPIEGAYLAAIRTIGEWIFHNGGFALMTSVASEVANADTNDSGRRVNILDKQWDMIGSDERGWWVS
jgi:hypothetical protein